MIKKKNLLNSGFCRPSGPQSENQRKRKESQVFRPCQRTKKHVEIKGDNDSNCNWRAWKGLLRLEKRTGRVGNQRTNRGHTDYSIIEIVKEY